MSGLTLDTSVLIAIERREARAAAWIEGARRKDLTITVPTVVIVEWWRRKPGVSQARILKGFVIEPLSHELATTAGEALGDVRAGPSLADAVVMASAARRGDRVLTSDVDDLLLLRDQVFRSVRVHQL